MSLSFKFIPLTFLNDEEEIKKQIRNTIILKYFFDRNSETVHLEDLITGTQYGHNASALVQGRNKFLRISDITDGKVNWKTVPYCNCTDEKTYLLFPNDILIARTGGTTGKSFLISEPPALSIYAGYLIRIRANEETNPDYLNLFLNSYVYWSQIVSLNEDNFRPSVNAEKLKKLILPFCDQNVQNDAVQISNGELISGYDYLYQLIDETLLKYDKLKGIQFEKINQLNLYTQLKKAIIQEALKGELTNDWRTENNQLQTGSELLILIKNSKEQLEKSIKRKTEQTKISNISIPYKLPNSWIWAKLDDLVIFTNGKAHEQFIDNMGKFILVNSKFVSTNGLVKKHTSDVLTPLYKDDIAIVMSDVPDGRALSRCFLVEENDLFTLNQRIGSLTPINGVYPKYLKMVLDRNPHYLSFNDGTKQTNLKKEEILLCPIPLPSLEEQIFIIKQVEKLMMKCQVLEDEILKSEKQANQLMQVILKEAFEVNKEIIETEFKN